MNFFQVIVEFFQRLWDFLSNMINMMVQAVVMLVAGVSGMQVIVMYMPAVIGSCTIVAIAVLFVRFLLMK